MMTVHEMQEYARIELNKATANEDIQHWAKVLAELEFMED
jgi:hypothetical protein